MARKPPKGKSLADLYPDVARQWHPTRNGDLSPFDFSYGSDIQVWWKCDKGDDHEWEAKITNKRRGDGCPICAGQKVVKSNCLATTHPEIAKQWHPKKNGSLTPYDVVSGSRKKVWWKCDKGDDHEWEAHPDSRKKGSGCSVCAGKKVVKSNCLTTTHPKLAKEWHHKKNGSLTPDVVVSGSGKKVWWKCDKADDHEWQANIQSRSKGSGCPMCSSGRMKVIVLSNCLATTHPEIAKQWHPTKNGKLSPFDVGFGSKKKVWWKCDKGDDHEWEAKITNKRRGDGCPICAGQKVVKSNCVATTHPEFLKEWHPNKNKNITPNDITSGSNKKIWWKCDKADDHEWLTVFRNRLNGDGCPICSGKKIVHSNCLATTHPEIAKQWHPTKNGKLSPFDLGFGSKKKIWWKCEKGDDHEWLTNPYSLVGCPICSNKKTVLSNCLATTHPEIAKQWHPTRNKPLTPYNIVFGSHKKIWWQCEKNEDHEWYVSGNSRKKHMDGCPFCTLTPQSKQELTITFELMQFFKDINPKGFKTRVKGKLWSVDIYIPQLNLGIEFDGSYWHKDKRALDKLKTKQLNKEGFDIIRVRETPLKKIFRTDILSKKPFNGKEVANKVLKQIMKMYDLDAKKVRKIENYLDKKELQNEKGLDKYIDMILTEKAEKNN